MIAPDAFIAASPREAAQQFKHDAIHLWRVPYHRKQGRVPLLALLGQYLEVDPASLALQDDEHGKPRLIRHASAARDRQRADGEALHFNWSHGGEIALIALTRNLEIGVDLEILLPRARTLELARRFFAPAEAEVLAAVMGAERDEAFLRLWCSKEAVLKALGHGLAFGLDRVAFAHQNGDWWPACFAAAAGDARDWHVAALNPAPGYVGALAWQGTARTIRAWQPAY